MMGSWLKTGVWLLALGLFGSLLAADANTFANGRRFKHLFFDDQRLFVRENLRRELGRPVPVAKYQDPCYDTPLCLSRVFVCPDGKYRMMFVQTQLLDRGVDPVRLGW